VKLRQALVLLICAVLAGCGSTSSEGGVTGTGITAISGNVLLVSERRPLPTGAMLPFAIRVTIAEVPELASTTDAEGTFQLAGDFSGALTLQFANADDGTEIGSLPLEVPYGSQTVLENIEIRIAAPPPERVQVRAVRQFDVFGSVDRVECSPEGTGVVLLTDDGTPPRQFMARLAADTEIRARSGRPLTCDDIRTRATLRVEGFLRRDDRTILAVQLIVAAPRPPQPGPSPRPERLRGVVRGVACESGLVEVEQTNSGERIRRIVRLVERTELRCVPEVPPPCDCRAIRIGTSIGVAGTILPERPGQVRADVVLIGSPSVPSRRDIPSAEI